MAKFWAFKAKIWPFWPKLTGGFLAQNFQTSWSGIWSEAGIDTMMMLSSCAKSGRTGPELGSKEILLWMWPRLHFFISKSNFGLRVEFA